MKFGDQLPTGRGWFWFKATGDFHPMRSTRKQFPIIVLVGQDLRVRFFSGTFHVKEMIGKWAGPIEQPED